VGLFDAVLGPLFGRTRLRKPDMDRLFKLTTAGPSLEAAELAADGRWAVCLRPVEGAEFAAAEQELRQLVDLACRSKDFHSRAEITRDSLGYVWIVFADPELEDGVTLVHLVGSTLQEKGYGEQLLAAVFRFRQSPPAAPGGDGPRYLIYNYKRGRFYPFVPGAGHTRDNAAEFRIGSALGELLPVETDLTRWFPLWDCPV
jgi:hypothetical protein